MRSLPSLPTSPAAVQRGAAAKPSAALSSDTSLRGGDQPKGEGDMSARDGFLGALAAFQTLQSPNNQAGPGSVGSASQSALKPEPAGEPVDLPAEQLSGKSLPLEGTTLPLSIANLGSNEPKLAEKPLREASDLLSQEGLVDAEPVAQKAAAPEQVSPHADLTREQALPVAPLDRRKASEPLKTAIEPDQLARKASAQEALKPDAPTAAPTQAMPLARGSALMEQALASPKVKSSAPPIVKGQAVHAASLAEPVMEDQPLPKARPAFSANKAPSALADLPASMSEAETQLQGPGAATSADRILATSANTNTQPQTGALAAQIGSNTFNPAASQASGDPRGFVQIEQAIEQFAGAREAARTARPEMTLRHNEFGNVNIRLEAISGETRATLTSRDPGFAPAVHAALGERVVAAASESASANNQNLSQRGGDQPQGQQFSGFQGQNSGSSAGNYGSSLGSGRGMASPYSGQESGGDEEIAGSERGLHNDTGTGPRNSGLFA